MAVIVGQGISVSPVADAELSHESTSTVQNKVVTDAIASEYSTSKTYSVGDVCTHDGKLYECIVDIPTAEGWTLAHWKVSNIGDVASKLNRQLSDVEDTIADSTTGLDTKAPVILETASGAIASFSDGADSMPIKKLVAQIEPVQDLHGYDHPWPGGSNGNIGDFTFGMGVDTSGNVSPINGRAATVNPIKIESGKSYYVKATGYNPKVIIAVWNGDTLVRRTVANPLDTALDVSGGTDLYVCVYENESTNAIVGVDENHIMLVTDNSITEYRPYSNECPISGWTGAEIEQTGKNLLDITSNYLEQGRITVSGEEVSATNRVRTHGFISVKESAQCTVSANGVDRVVVYEFKNDETINYVNNVLNTMPHTFTAKSGTSKLRLVFGLASGSDITPGDVSNVQLELGSTATDYKPYAGNQISVNWEDEAGTVYGGMLTLNPDRTGTLVVDMAKIVLDNTLPADLSGLRNVEILSNSARAEYYPYREIGLGSGAPVLSDKFTTGIISSQTGPFIIGTGNFAIQRLFFTFPLEINTLALMRNWFAENPTTAIIKLATPQTYQLTAEQISGILSTLYGQNNIWSSTGDTEVTYPADTKLYIDGKITQAMANALNS